MASLVVFRQLRDVIATQEVLVEKLRQQIAVLEENSVSRVEYETIVEKLEEEVEEHAKTKRNLAKESEQLEFALGEIEVLSNQLKREKQAFDNALSNVKNKALKESIQKDKLKSKCTGESVGVYVDYEQLCTRLQLEEIESHIQKQEDILNSKNNEIKELQHFVNKQKQTLKKQASDLKIQKQQEYYISKVLGEKPKKSVK